MRHFSCDLCGRSLTPCGETRYLVRVEGFPVADPADATLADAVEDPIDAMDELLAATPPPDDRDGDTVEMMPVTSVKEYDLCGSCYGKLQSDPLGLQARRKVRVSRN